MNETRKRETLVFRKPDNLRNQLQTTFRVGKKWLNKFEKGGRDLRLADTKGNIFGDATAVGAAYLPLEMIPEDWIAKNADHEVRTFGQLYASLIEQYGDDKVSFDSFVCVLFFTIDTVS